MNVAITGGTGMLGSRLAAALHARGDTTSIVSRQGGDGRIRWDPAEGFASPGALGGHEAVVHLAGAGVADQRWSEARKREIMDSRRQGTRSVVEAIGHAQPPPRVLVSASAVGYYGDSGQAVMTESSPPGDDFLARACVAWEQQADAATALGVRVVKLRFGVILSPDGGALPRMLPAFKLGAGGRLGSGEQFMSWIHIDDAVAAALHVLSDDTAHGVYNVTAPQPVDNATFTAALGEALHRPTFMRVPAFALKALFGEMSTVLLAGQRVVPTRLLERGFTFRHPEVRAALRDVLSTDAEGR